VKGKLKEAIDTAREHSSPGSDGNESDEDSPIAPQVQKKKEDARHKATSGDRYVVPRGGFFSTGRKDILKLGVVMKPCTMG
jgi:hypothetical protein